MDFKSLIEYQNMLQQKLRQEQKTDRKIEFLSLINELTSGPRNLVQKEQVLIEAKERGFTETETQEIIDKLIAERIIFEPNSGYLKKR